MQAFVKSYIEKIKRFLKTKNAKTELLLVGGLAMSFYGIPRFTADIDGEINCNEEIYFGLLEYFKKEKTPCNISDNINGWGIVPLPEGYRSRARIVYKSKELILKILEPIDFVFSKLLRGTEEDFQDIVSVIKKYRITKDELKEREKNINFPRDPETLFFKKKFSHLMELLL